MILVTTVTNVARLLPMTALGDVARLIPVVLENVWDDFYLWQFSGICVGPTIRFLLSWRHVWHDFDCSHKYMARLCSQTCTAQLAPVIVFENVLARPEIVLETALHDLYVWLFSWICTRLWLFSGMCGTACIFDDDGLVSNTLDHVQHDGSYPALMGYVALL